MRIAQAREKALISKQSSPVLQHENRPDNHTSPLHQHGPPPSIRAQQLGCDHEQHSNEVLFGLCCRLHSHLPHAVQPSRNKRSYYKYSAIFSGTPLENKNLKNPNFAVSTHYN